MFLKKIFNRKGKKLTTEKIVRKTTLKKEKIKPREKVQPRLKKAEPRKKVAKTPQKRLLTAEGWERRRALH